MLIAAVAKTEVKGEPRLANVSETIRIPITDVRSILCMRPSSPHRSPSTAGRSKLRAINHIPGCEHLYAVIETFEGK
jgi:hypothetical protein